MDNSEFNLIFYVITACILKEKIGDVGDAYQAMVTFDKVSQYQRFY